MTPQLLLFAEPLLRDGLIRLLQARAAELTVISDPADLRGAPQILLWALEADMAPEQLQLQLQLLQERWQPAPLLLVLSTGHRLPAPLLLQLPATGLLEAPEPDALIAAIHTLLEGGRVLELRQPVSADQPADRSAAGIGLGQWLLLSGLQQVDADIQACLRLLTPPGGSRLQQLVLQGRLRELRSARQLLLLLWGPLSVAWGPQARCTEGSARPEAGAGAAKQRTALTLQQRNADGIWASLATRLRAALAAGPGNGSGQLLALAALRPERRSDLLLALLDQLQMLRQQLASEAVAAAELGEHWLRLQPQLRQMALRAMASPYVQLPREGQLCGVAEQLIREAALEVTDPELPQPQPMLATLVLAQPLLVEGQLLPADEPRAVLHLELLVSNWLVRNAELLAADVLASCAAWPELRRYLLRPELLSTRSLERLRNQLNAQLRWQSWWQRPVALYESRRVLFGLQESSVVAVNLTEPRDTELRQLGWPQQLVTLALESRDALAPQVQALARGLGDLLVVLLTQVLGRAIGLVGRGIVQGMGRSLRASQ
ncbi:DUF3685 domain-containing protein [Synechococcus sp. GFB01]|uniref:DUF3685 domain-containing protein n=1 Tax=Synechococcus sp. GFB01 TaxID=1662190 RepID=UPI00069CBEC6|nr:DUF3685 domain-containing protein [Synechococcus sp. GFB01]